jgi:hypothetical protein
MCCAVELRVYLVDLNADSPQNDEGCLHKLTLKT